MGRIWRLVSCLKTNQLVWMFMSGPCWCKFCRNSATAGAAATAPDGWSGQPSEFAVIIVGTFWSWRRERRRRFRRPKRITRETSLSPACDASRKPLPLRSAAGGRSAGSGCYAKPTEALASDAQQADVGDGQIAGSRAPRASRLGQQQR
jgi:hypothetical protein